MELIYADESEKTIREIIENQTLLGCEFKESLRKLCYHSSYVSKEYPKTYYKKGLIFESHTKPTKWIPVDEWGLRQGKYLAGFERFMFDDLESMLKEFPNSISAQKMVYYWRKAYELILNNQFEEKINFFGGIHEDNWKQNIFQAIEFVYGNLKNAKKRIKDWKRKQDILAPSYIMNDRIQESGEITEVLFKEKPRIKPIAVFGFEKSISSLPVYNDALDFFLKKEK